MGLCECVKNRGGSETSGVGEISQVFFNRIAPDIFGVFFGSLAVLKRWRKKKHSILMSSRKICRDWCRSRTVLRNYPQRVIKAWKGRKSIHICLLNVPILWSSLQIFPVGNMEPHNFHRVFFNIKLKQAKQNIH